MASSSEPHVSLFEQFKTILSPILERLNQNTPLTRDEIQIMFNLCDYTGIDYNSFIAWYFKDEDDDDEEDEDDEDEDDEICPTSIYY
jgi:regulator of RNase E activity RraB